MSTPLTPSKRPHERSLAEPNGKGKLQKSTSLSKSSPGSIILRVVCPASKTGIFIENGGTIISQIQQETGAKVRVEETIPASDERVIVIMDASELSSEGTEVGSKRSEERSSANVAEENEDKRESGKNDENKESDSLKDVKSVKESSTLQKALVLVFERIVEPEPKAGGGNEETDKSTTVVLRLLVLSSQIGCLLGKGGSVIKQMSSESGAQIRIIPRDKLPSFASATDELVQITGEVDAVRKALQSVSQQLLENPQKDHDTFTPTTVGQSSHSFGPNPDMYPTPNHSFISQGAPNAGPRGIDFHSAIPPPIPGRMMYLPDMLTFRLLCHHDRVGGIIGKGGAIIKTITQETGSEIKVVEGSPDSPERIILIAGPAHPDDRISAAQEAVIRVLTRMVRAMPDGNDKTVMARLLVSNNQIGCLLGKGGSVIAEMRKLSGAHIRILGKDQVPKCASEGDEVVQINGEYEAVREALLHITSRLRHHYFRDSFHAINHPSNPAYLDQAPPFAPYMGRRELSPPGMGPPFHHFDAFGGPPPHGGFHPHDDPPFMHNIHRPNMLPHMSERKPWGPQGFVAGGGPMGFSDFTGVPHRRSLGFGGGSQPAIITSTTVEVVVPRSLVPIIHGEDGACLQQIHEISDAKIIITDPKPGAAETVIIISGTPEQTHAAQSLIQAFVMSEREPI
ncbi:hypothetical protein SLEP1_g42004 [Rubroshorea leprosula]|uniref:K Homology domain-containing protein n=1 Tax=Rubroshorea leprosula TaxID=152421 RepID=A0AAV5L8E2_9ROSI|nr:hypothetical protein SLEP1_g42004 [Rubroshorea leprosula]